MKLPAPWMAWLDADKTAPPEIRRVQIRITRHILLILALAGLPAVLAGALSVRAAGVPLFAPIYLLLYLIVALTALFKSRLSEATRRGVILVVPVTIAAVMLLNLGLSGGGISLLIASVILATTIVSRRAGLLVLLLGLLCIGVSAGLFLLGTLPTEAHVLDSSLRPLSWLTAALLFVMLCATILFSTLPIQHRLIELMGEHRQDAARIIEANRKLEEAIAKQHDTEKQLRRSETRFRELAEMLPVTVFEATADGRLLYANRSGFETFGYPDDAIERGVSGFSILDPRDVQRARENIMRVLSGENRGLVEYRAVGRGGVPMKVLIHSTRWMHGDEVKGLRGVIIDITERKRMEERMQQASKLEALGTLAGGVAHDFNNLLMGIEGQASYMLSEIEKDHPHHAALSSIEDHVRSAAGLTRQLLGLSRRGKYEVQASDINRLIQRTVSMFARTNKNFILRTELQADIWTVDVDRSQIEQVLLNLLLNARQAMPQGGEIIVRSYPCDISKESEANGLSSGDYVCVEVEDRGEGIPEDVVEHIFEPFFSTRPGGRGTGLGLASAFAICSNHGGHIGVESQPGQGALFRLHLPARREPPPLDKEPSPEIPHGDERLLLVDDEELIHEVGVKLLGKLGYQVVSARSGEEAVRRLRADPDAFDLVLLDMIMPGMGGEQTFNALREVRADLPVLLSSGFSIDDHAHAALRAGCNGFIQKPYSMRVLAQRIRQILDD